MRFSAKTADNPRENDTKPEYVAFWLESLAMLNRNGRATLTASLVADRRGPALDAILAAESAPTILFPAKHAAAPTRRVATLTPAHETQARLSVRLSREQLWRTRLAAAFVRQSCQALLADALDGHLARLARDPALGMLLEGPAGPNG